MELTEQDKKAAEEWYNDQIIKANQEEHVFNVGYEEFWLPLSATPESAFLAGIEHERKRQNEVTKAHLDGSKVPEGYEWRPIYLGGIFDPKIGAFDLKPLKVDNPPAEGCQKEDGHE